MKKDNDFVIPDFSTRLRTAIRNKNMTMIEFAQRLKVTKNTMYAWCSDMWLPNAGYLKQICEMLDVSADYLLELSDEVS